MAAVKNCRLLIALLCFAALAGCKKNPAISVTNPGEPAAPSGWEKLENAEQGISVYAPPNWKIGAAASMDLPAMGGMTDSAGGSGMEQFMAEQQKEQEKADAEAAKALEAKGIYLSVIDKGRRAIPGEERTRFYVKAIKGNNNATMDDVKAAVRETMTGENDPKPVDIPIGKAVRTDSTVTLRDGGVVHSIGYGVPNKDSVYVVIFITEEAPNAIDDIEKGVMDSLRISK